MQLAIANPLKKRRTHKRKSSSSRKVKRNPIANLGAYAKKRRSSRKRKAAAASAAPVARRISSLRRRGRRSSGGGAIGRTFSRVANSGISGFMSSVAPAAVGAAGALGIDLAWGYVPIPDQFKTGPLAPVTRIAASVGVGLLAGAVLGKKFGREAMAGALTVTIFDLTKGFLKNNTSLPLSYYAPRGLSYYAPRGLSYYAPSNGYASENDIDPEGYAWDTLQYGLGT